MWESSSFGLPGNLIAIFAFEPRGPPAEEGVASLGGISEEGVASLGGISEEEVASLGGISEEEVASLGGILLPLGSIVKLDRLTGSMLPPELESRVTALGDLDDGGLSMVSVSLLFIVFIDTWFLMFLAFDFSSFCISLPLPAKFIGFGGVTGSVACWNLSSTSI